MQQLMLSMVCLCLLWVPGSAALLFGGTDDVVVTANVTGAPAGYPFTVAAVINTSTTTVGQALAQVGAYLAGNQTGWIWYPTTTGGGFMGVYNSATDSGVDIAGAVPINTWVFVAWSSASATSHRAYCYNLATQAMVFNATSTTSLGAITAPNTSNTIGMQKEGATTFTTPFAGTITWAALYAVDLTIQNGDGLQAMAVLGPLVIANPSLLYTFNEMTGTVVRDKMGVGGNGTMTNFPASPWQPISIPGPVAP